MPYQYVREPLTAEEADRLANACDTPTEKLVVWTLLDTGLRVGELCDLTSKRVLSQHGLRGVRIGKWLILRFPCPRSPVTHLTPRNLKEITIFLA